MGRRKNSNNTRRYEQMELDEHGGMKKEIVGIIIIAIATLLEISVFYGENSDTLLNGVHIATKYLFGWFSMIVPIYIIIQTLMVLKDEEKNYDYRFIISTLIAVMLVGAFPALSAIEDIAISIERGGALGMALSFLIYKLGGVVGGYVILTAMSVVTFMIYTKMSFVGLVKKGAKSAKQRIEKSLYREDYDDEDEEDYDATYEYEHETTKPMIDNRSTKNYDIRLDEDYQDDEEDEDDYDNEEMTRRNIKNSYNVAQEDEDDDEEEDYYEEDDYDQEDDDDYYYDEEQSEEKPKSFFGRIFGKKTNSKIIKMENKDDKKIIEILGKEEDPKDVERLMKIRNEGLVDISFWEDEEETNHHRRNSATITPINRNGNINNSDSYDEDYEDDDYEEEIDDNICDDYAEAEDFDFDLENDGDEDDNREVQIGYSKDAMVLDNQKPMMKPISTTDDEKDDGGNYENNIVKNNPFVKKREIKLVDDDGTEETIQVEDEPIEYVYPKVALLSKPPAKKGGDSKTELRKNSKVLEETLQSFKVKATVTGVTKGPAVTRYELELATGVKVSTIQNLADDIALHMASSGVRIAPVPGKAAIGIEIANKEPSSVFMREVLDNEDFRSAKSKLAVCLGKGIDGKTVLMDIAKMPHILIAGATGSGKSVCINTIITSIIYKASPDEVKLIMVDPKVVELKMYSGIPHLLIPVVTEPKKAASALNWAVEEMLERYKFFADNNVKNLQGYNELMEKQGKRKIPQIVIIIDELADLMMAAGKEVEDAICRLAQMARAAGMHLIIATQRPSVDVITGLIKANVPSRIAFAVSSATDSRTILDAGGAEKLLGKGDMLYFPVGANKPTRIQGAFVSEAEVEKVVDFIKQHHTATYNDDVIKQINENAAKKDNDKSQGNSKEDDGGDEALLYDAVELINDKKKASISMFQRAFKIGYNRAANLMELLEEKGYVGPDEGTKPRKVYFDAIRDTMEFLD